jgi:hypothetical protein
MRPATRELAGVYLVLAAADVPRVRSALHTLGLEVTQRQRAAIAAEPSRAMEVAA